MNNLCLNELSSPDYLDRLIATVKLHPKYCWGQANKSSFRLECKTAPYVITCRKEGIIDVEGYKFCKRFVGNSLDSCSRIVHACFESYQ